MKERKDNMPEQQKAAGHVAVVGFGYVGLSVGTVLASRGAKVTGIDIRKEVTAAVNAGLCPVNEPGLPGLVRKQKERGHLQATTDFAAAAHTGTIILAVGTPLDDNNQPVMRDLRAAYLALAPHLKQGQLVIVKSTIPPGTTRETVAKLLAEHSRLQAGRDFALACCPERLAEGRMLEDINSLPVIVGGLTPADTRRAASFWQARGWDTIEVSGPEEAEMSKLADNLWIDVNIALANEIALLCTAMGIDVLEVINAANTLPKGMHNVNILFPGPGVGGSCLVKDPWFVHGLGRQAGLQLKLPAAAREVNDAMPRHVVELTAGALAETGRQLQGSTVAVLGAAFKHKTGDMRHSPTIPLVRELQRRGASVLLCDPWVDSKAAISLFGAYITGLESNPEQAAGRADAVIVMVAHPEFLLPPERWAQLTGGKAPFIDCRFVFNQREMLRAGLPYYALGRGRRTTAGREGKLCREF